ncbi:MAG: 4-hydroxy-3-methylbut-2-enyl diphosphate reductase [Alistipes sp.]|nr:4-hydroxy-3-methylbut-2-enyl diphosphate reductase [Rikenellaceae bacterium]MBQ7311678.1 4-hydroxy-3-methylbut-2-enyl diphosphate reductase [Alistipes sp.]
MKVTIDSHSGFCAGVVRAISEAESAIEKWGSVSCLGDIVHNRIEVQRLEAMGLRTINHDGIKELTAGSHMLIRAHGEPPTTYALAKSVGVEVIDATCPVVAALQRRVQRAYKAMKQCGGQLVILGKHGHAEVVGLIGQVGGDAVVIESEAEVDAIDFSRPVYLLSQTTQSVALFERLCKIIEDRLTDGATLTADDTICRRVSSREEHLRRFAKSHDIVIFVCGRKSSNGKVLYNICLEENPRSYNIEEASELVPEWFTDAQTVGVCGATSTPLWLMESVAKQIEKL